MDSTPTFEKPPIVEFVLGAQFARLGLSSAHFGRFWDAIGDGWRDPRDNPLIPDQFEHFGRGAASGRLRLQLEQGPPVWQGLDLGHEVAVDHFLSLVAEDTIKRWGEKADT